MRKVEIARETRDSISIKSIESDEDLKAALPPTPRIDKCGQRARTGSGSLIIGKVQAYRVDGDSISRVIRFQRSRRAVGI